MKYTNEQLLEIIKDLAHIKSDDGDYHYDAEKCGICDEKNLYDTRHSNYNYKFEWIQHLESCPLYEFNLTKEQILIQKQLLDDRIASEKQKYNEYLMQQTREQRKLQYENLKKEFENV